MAKTTTTKKVIARFTGKGFYLKGNNVGQKCTVVYLDTKSFQEAESDDFINDLLVPFISAIATTLQNKRIKPGSLRITFHILEK